MPCKTSWILYANPAAPAILHESNRRADENQAKCATVKKNQVKRAADKLNQVQYKPALSRCSEKCALFPSARRNTKAEYIMLPLSFPHLAICITYFTFRRKHLSFWNEISIYSRTFSECQNQGSLKKFLPDRNISTRKESATHRRAKIASNRHSINRNKHVEGQFYIKRLVPGKRGCRLSICRPSIQAFLRTDGCMPRLPFM